MSLRYFFDKFDYYAKPEGQDPLNKIVGVSKYCAFTGILIGTNDIIAISKTKTFYDSARCLGFWVVPLTGMGCAFASTTYIATNLRGKDDPWNYVIGACGAGSVLSLWSKCFLTTLYGTIFLSIFAACKKDSIESGWTFFSQEPSEAEMKYPFFSTAGARAKTYERSWTT
ncbi:NADH dehydrogenase [ubiquinone] 1 alpha subcomplex subunit 11 [Leptopilina boulardi]|uniref:NADH dehydrogenase [ubiquinone] 1 alpha subcomplex subunit 11 n=1 Tax=Leptopilina boulardi TaxID=63433 RepID=UPI0021F69282|nr:NADH dehydrogenase [ubiquinone] 1 alpha subcomplex subunit 11 [Leptopilina boulardi]